MKKTGSFQTSEMLVSVRVRPFNDFEHQIPGCFEALSTSKEFIVVENADSDVLYAFDTVFGTDDNNKCVYDRVADPIVQSCVSGVNGAIMAYGQTASGKTFCMQGCEEDPGLIALCAKRIFELVADREYTVTVTYLEIYKEKIRDLLYDDNYDLRIREDPQYGFHVEGLQEVQVSNHEDVWEIFLEGQTRRHIAGTDMNEVSSRSHTIFTINMLGRESDDGPLIRSRLSLVDLAGSENIRSTNAEGERLKEGGQINKSLLALSMVISSLANKDAHVRFRDSKLTQILQPCLSGNCRSAIICCVTPASLYVPDTTATLKFATSARKIQTSYSINEVMETIRTSRREGADVASELRMQNQLARMERSFADELHRMVDDATATNERLQSLEQGMQSLVTEIQIKSAHASALEASVTRIRESAEKELVRLKTDMEEKTALELELDDRDERIVELTNFVEAKALGVEDLERRLQESELRFNQELHAKALVAEDLERRLQESELRFNQELHAKALVAEDLERRLQESELRFNQELHAKALVAEDLERRLQESELRFNQQLHAKALVAEDLERRLQESELRFNQELHAKALVAEDLERRLQESELRFNQELHAKVLVAEDLERRLQESELRFNQELQHREQELEASQTEYAKAIQESQATRHALERTHSELSSTADKLTRTSEEAQQSQQFLSAKESELESLRKEHESAVRSMKEELETKIFKLGSLEEKLAQVESELVESNRRYADLEEKQDALRTETNGIVEKQREELETALREGKTMILINEDLSKRLIEVETSLTSLQESSTVEKDELESLLSLKSSELEALVSKERGWTETTESLRTDIARLQQEKELAKQELQQQLQTLESDLAAAKESLGDKQRELEGRIQEQSLKEQQWAQEKSSFIQDLESSRAKIELLQESVAEFNRTTEALRQTREEFAQFAFTHDKLETKHKETMDEMISLQTELERLGAIRLELAIALSEAEKLSAEVESGASSLKEMESRVVELETTLGNERELRSTVEKQMKEMEQDHLVQLKAMEDRLLQASTEQSIVQQQQSIAFKSEIESLIAQLEAAISGRDEAAMKATNLDSELRAVTEEMDSLRDVNDKLSQELQVQTELIASVNEECVKLNERLALADTERLQTESTLRLQIASRNEALQTETARVTELLKEIETLHLQSAAKVVETETSMARELESLQNQLQNELSKRAEMETSMTRELEALQNQLQEKISKEESLLKQMNLLQESLEETTHQLQSRANVSQEEFDSIKVSLETYTGQVQSFISQVDVLSEDLTISKADLNKARDEIQSLSSMLEASEREKQSLSNEMDSIHTQLKEMSTTRDEEMSRMKVEMEEKVSRAMADMEVTANELNVSKAELEQALSATSELHNQLEKLQKDLVASRDESMARVKEMEQERDSLQSDLDRVIKERDAALGDFSSQVVAFDKQTELLKKEIESLESRVKEQNEMNETRLHLLEEDLTAARSQLSESGRRWEETSRFMEEELREVKDELEAVMEDKSTANAEVLRLVEELDNFKSKADAALEENTQMQEELTRVTEELMETKITLESKVYEEKSVTSVKIARLTEELSQIKLDAEFQIKTLMEEQSRQLMELSRVTHELKASELERESLMEIKMCLDADLAKVQDEMIRKKFAAAELEAELKGEKNRTAELSSTILEAKRQVISMESELRKARGESEIQAQTIQLLLSEKEHKTDELCALDEELSRCRTELRTSTELLAEKDEEITRLREVLNIQKEADEITRVANELRSRTSFASTKAKELSVEKMKIQRVTSQLIHSKEMEIGNTHGRKHRGKEQERVGAAAAVVVVATAAEEGDGIEEESLHASQLDLNKGYDGEIVSADPSAIQLPSVERRLSNRSTSSSSSSSSNSNGGNQEQLLLLESPKQEKLDHYPQSLDISPTLQRPIRSPHLVSTVPSLEMTTITKDSKGLPPSIVDTYHPCPPSTVSSRRGEQTSYRWMREIVHLKTKVRVLQEQQLKGSSSQLLGLASWVETQVNLSIEEVCKALETLLEENISVSAHKHSENMAKQTAADRLKHRRRKPLQNTPADLFPFASKNWSFPTEQLDRLQDLILRVALRVHALSSVLVDTQEVNEMMILKMNMDRVSPRPYEDEKMKLNQVFATDVQTRLPKPFEPSEERLGKIQQQQQQEDELCELKRRYRDLESILESLLSSGDLVRKREWSRDGRPVVRYVLASGSSPVKSAVESPRATTIWSSSIPVGEELVVKGNPTLPGRKPSPPLRSRSPFKV